MAERLREEWVTSFYRVRQMLGWLGFVLPLFLILGGWMSLGHVEPSISDYYHTLLRDILVGVMVAIGLFLMTYPGHRRGPGEWVSDDLMTTMAGIAALGLALFPNAGPGAGQGMQSAAQLLFGPKGAAIGHHVFAVSFLMLLGLQCLLKFARSEKPARRRLYRACGWTILTMTALVVLASWFKLRGPAGPQALVNDWLLVLWFEALAIWAFALAWLVKGRADQALLGKGRGGR